MLRGALDSFQRTLPMDRPTVLHGTLENATTAALFVTGYKIKISENASATLYNPAFLDSSLQPLRAGQRWEGPLISVRPAHRGTLLVSGSLVFSGGASAGASTTLLTLPFRLQIADLRRNLDGSAGAGVSPVCDRALEACCDFSEPLCFQRAGRCFYVAQGFGHQAVCLNGKEGKRYDRIFDLKVSSDGAHVAYLAGVSCLEGGDEKICRKTVVLDGAEHPAADQPTQLALSPDGMHYAYVGRPACVLRNEEERCSGPARVVRDGHQGPPEEAVRALAFSADRVHLDYDAGRRCNAKLECRQWRHVETP
jgi:hypothetical protein